MEFQALTIAPSHQQLAVFRHRGLFYSVEAFHIILVLSCTFFHLAISGSYSVDGVQKSTEYDLCGSYKDNYDLGSQNIFFGDTSSDSGNPKISQSHKSICTSAHLFCFPSTLHGFSSEEFQGNEAVMGVKGSQSDQACEWASNSSWSSDYGMFKLFNGRTISCSLISREGTDELSSIQNDIANQTDISSCRAPLLNQKTTSFMPNMNPKMTESDSSYGSSSVHVKLSPPVLDWGKKYIYSPSIVFLTVENTMNDSILHVYEPFSTDIQFYPCNFSKVLLGPGEVASVCFVFLPRKLGFSSAHLILQTSLGGFLLQAKGFTVESPYNIQPSISMEVTSSGSRRYDLSLFNPFDETLYVEEVTAWISVSLENTLHYIEAVCSLDEIQGADEISLLISEKWLDVKSDQAGSPLLAMKPYGSWEVAPRYTKTIIETDFAGESEGKFFGAFCIKLVRSSQDKSDMMMLPLDAKLPRKEAYDARVASVSVSLEALVPFDDREAVFVALSLENGAPFLLSVDKINEVTDKKLFQIKYMEGLLLFPGTMTQAAVISCTHLFVELQESPPEVFNTNKNCKLVIMTNDSSSPQIGVPCQDIINMCSRHQKNSYIGYDDQSEKVESGSIRTGSFESHVQFPSQVKISETAEADELVLGNWKSQGTTSGMSVLDDREVLFPMVQVGAHSSKWITVKNPSSHPVIMQLILNSGEIIDECRGLDGFVEPPSSGSLVRNQVFTPTRYGFSIAESTLTEAYVHPYGRASFGPIFFHPSNRCGWRSSVLIRNNLSGVEWLSLRGFGGSLSLVLLEGSEPVQIVEFHPNLPVPFNISPPDKFSDMDDVTHACSQPFSKVLYIKNTGDLPLDVKKIKVSGTECGLDGFVIHYCKGFALEPGEATKILISYQTDFSAAMVHRDLELALGTGILVIPMKASIPVYMLNLCKKSMVWLRVKKLSVAVLAASLIFMVFCCIFFQAIALGSQDYGSRRSEKSSIPTSNAGKSLHCNQRDSKFQVSYKISTLFKSVREDRTSLLGSTGRQSKHQGGTAEQETTTQHAKPTLENERQENGLLHTRKEKASPSSLLSKPIAVESLDMLEASQPGNLTVRIGKEKGRRRRKRKGTGTGLTGLVEVSSSQSGNSTPSSPLSPFSFVMPKRMSQFSPDGDQCTEARNPFARVAEQKTEKSIAGTAASQPSIIPPEVSVKYSANDWFFSSQQQPILPRKTPSKPALLPSATFPSAGRPVHNMLCSSPFLAETSTVAPHARAPGSKLYNQTTLKTEEKERLEDDYQYDIWGDHFCGFQSMVRAKDDQALSSNDTESNSISFFVRGPQTLVNTPQPRSVSDFHQKG